MFAVNLGISLKSGKQPRRSNSNWIVIRNFLFLGFVSNSNWIVIRNFQFLGFVPLLSYEFQFHILFSFYFILFFWLAIWVIREEGEPFWYNPKKKKKRKIEREFARGTKTEFARGRTILVQPKKKKKDREGEFTGCMPAKVKSDLPPLTDSCDPTVSFFFFFFFKWIWLYTYIWLDWYRFRCLG